MFVDRLGHIVITEGVARFAFLRLNAIDAEKNSHPDSPTLSALLTAGQAGFPDA